MPRFLHPVPYGTVQVRRKDLYMNTGRPILQRPSLLWPEHLWKSTEISPTNIAWDVVGQILWEKSSLGLHGPLPVYIHGDPHWLCATPPPGKVARNNFSLCFSQVLDWSLAYSVSYLQPEKV